MLFSQKLMIVWVLASVTAGLLVASPAERPSHVPGISRRAAAVIVLMTIIEAALMVVGMVSHTLNIHVVQTIPLVVALVVTGLDPDTGVSAAAPLFAFWLLIMGGIWLFLLGIAPVFTGTFSLTEIVLTVVIGVACVAGLVQTYRAPNARLVAVRLTTAMVFCALQTAALWISYLPIVAGR
jgi:hypothetical protein